MKCGNCRLVNFKGLDECARCGSVLEAAAHNSESKYQIIVRRAVICLSVCLFMLAAFYLSLIASAKRLGAEQQLKVERSIRILEEKGFTREAFLLNYLSALRSEDNWLNSAVPKENAFAATNFPFEIITLYSDFFTYPEDDTERAAILLHEARHLIGANEHDAYAYVWNNRHRLGWTRTDYFQSVVWQNVRKQTREDVPELFTCPDKPFNDCTE